MSLEDFYAIDPYSLDRAQKEKMLSARLCELTRLYAESCPEYAKILKALGVDAAAELPLSEVPFIPVRLFKMFELMCVPREEIVKTMMSSGTSGQAVSKIFLSKENVVSQTKTLSAIISSFIGKQRLPLLMLDTELVKKDRSMFSARGAGIIGFSTFGRDVAYALDADMKIDVKKISEFLSKHEREPILMFGYTYMVWQFVVRSVEDARVKFNLENAMLFHIGGWKKLKDQAVDALTYNERVRGVFGNVKVYNYYGMAEQLGSVFVECEHGHMHCSNYSDVIIRRPKDFSVAGVGERGLIQILSALPASYPGHSLLTEDEGEIIGEDDCPCGRKGKYFKIHGRIKAAELRGCSDTYERR